MKLNRQRSVAALCVLFLTSSCAIGVRDPRRARTSAAKAASELDAARSELVAVSRQHAQNLFSALNRVVVDHVLLVKLAKQSNVGLDRIEEEYGRVLRRPKFAIDPVRLEALTALFAWQERVVAGVRRGKRALHEEDEKFMEVAAVSRDRILISGNLRHFPVACWGGVEVLQAAKQQLPAKKSIGIALEEL
ncbi:MAG: hypothetical protein EBZ78_09635, partial [Verrucomicrobia bacterium]|nr:hypothetical protein [Verrucomicrobiota bacterium]